MSSGMVFVLHNGADQKYAAELAEALAPIPAIAAALPEGEAQRLMFGRGAACVLVWSGAASQAEAFTAALPEGAAAVALALNDNAPPSGLSARASIVRGAGAPALDAESLRGAIAGMHAALRDRLTRNTRRGASPRLAVQTDTTDADRKPMLARSVMGLTFTLAAVGLGAAFISSRTQAAPAKAADTPVAAPPASAEAAAVEAAADAPANAMALGDLTVQEPTSREAAQAVTYTDPPPAAPPRAAAAAVDAAPSQVEAPAAAPASIVDPAENDAAEADLSGASVAELAEAPALSPVEEKAALIAAGAPTVFSVLGFEDGLTPLSVKQRAIAPRLK